MSANTVRLPEALQAEAITFADQLGISFNALCAVALRDYLDARLALAPLRRGAVVPAPLPGVNLEHGAKGRAPRTAAVSLPSISTQAGGSLPSVPKVGANDPCPCGSGLKYKRCHGKPGA